MTFERWLQARGPSLKEVLQERFGRENVYPGY